MSSPLLVLENISKNFDNEFLLDSIDLDLLPGEVHVIIGENGSGKSALMKIVSGLYSRDSGSIRLKGEEIEFDSFHAARKGGIFYQHQDNQLFGNLSVAENVFFDRYAREGRLCRYFSRSRTELECAELLRYFGIDFNPALRVSRLGYAERQLLSAVKAYVSGAEVVIFDEPTAAMGEIERNLFFKILEELKERVEGIFYISHRMDEIRRVGDRVTVIHKGRVVSTNRVHEIDKTTLVGMMIEDPHRERYPRLSLRPGGTIMEVRELSSEPILHSVSFSLRRQEILGITGLMGSGRTLLSNCLFGLAPYDGGEIILHGRQVRFNHPLDAMQSGVILVPENRSENGIFPPLNLITNLTIATLSRFLNSLALNELYMRQLTGEYIRRLGILPGQFKDILRFYSGGNQQKVLLSRSFMCRAGIYIMDEPTRGVDAAAKVDIYNSINDLIGKGASVILISSEIEEILGMCDRVLVLAGGRIACDLPREEATKEIILDYATSEE
ncbi:sugar ABC transporter ATP-binding protein [Marispirochaeta aestuarii]|uniref:sugar ABC transporter ATP-binding protein n=1 Tax=Marispirochaeta aestuarii TaxID=1963862 RepID=UPI001E6410A1|nr:sugar ABC transporter ATP-binding protein [Marispirochaeta aestuarii]